MAGSAPLVGIIMGSKSDWETMANAAKALDALGIAYEVRSEERRVGKECRL